MAVALELPEEVGRRSGLRLSRPFCETQHETSRTSLAVCRGARGAPRRMPGHLLRRRAGLPPGRAPRCCRLAEARRPGCEGFVDQALSSRRLKLRCQIPLGERFWRLSRTARTTRERPRFELVAAAIHDVPRGGDDEEPRLTDAPIVLDDALRLYFVRKTRDSLEARASMWSQIRNPTPRSLQMSPASANRGISWSSVLRRSRLRSTRRRPGATPAASSLSSWDSSHHRDAAGRAMEDLLAAVFWEIEGRVVLLVREDELARRQAAVSAEQARCGRASQEGVVATRSHGSSCLMARRPRTSLGRRGASESTTRFVIRQ